jgi:ankyrin repeat protein
MTRVTVNSCTASTTTAFSSREVALTIPAIPRTVPYLRELARAAVPCSLLNLPPEVLLLIACRLDPPSKLAFAGAAIQTRALYSNAELTQLAQEKRDYLAWLSFEKQCLALLAFRTTQRYIPKIKHTLKEYYTKILAQVLRQDNSDDACEKATLLAEKFAQCFTRKDMKAFINEALASQPRGYNWQAFIDRLARINLHFCVTLITQAAVNFNIANDEPSQLCMARKKMFYPFTKYYALLADKLQFNCALPARPASNILSDNIKLNDVRAEQFFRQARLPTLVHNTILHFAAAYNYLDIIPALIRNQPQRINLINIEGQTVLTMICAQNWSNRSVPQLDRLAVIRVLLQLGANPNIPDHSGTPALMYMARQNNLAGLALLLEYGAEINQQNNKRETVLFYAHRVEIVAYLLKRGALINQQNIEHTTPLMQVCRVNVKDNNFQEYVNIARLLVSHHAPVNLQNTQGMTALMYACQEGNAEVIDLLLTHHATINLQNNQGMTALMYACQTANSDIVQSLLAQHADFNLQDKRGLTALMHACQTKNTDIIALLLTHNIDIDTQDNQGLTALIHACQTKHTDTVMLLLKHHANPNIKDNQGLTALIHACLTQHTEAIKQLLVHNADLHLQDKQGLTALIYTSQKGNADALSLLLEHGAAVNARDKNQITALMCACRREDNAVPLVAVLLNAGAQPNLQDAQGQSALMHASQTGNLETLRLLLTHGANLDQTDSQGLTALMHASQAGHIETIRLLLAQGAKLDQEDQHGVTAFMHACQQGRADTVRFFLKQDNNKPQNINQVKNSLVKVQKLIRLNHKNWPIKTRYQYEDVDMQLRLWLRKHLPQHGAIVQNQ